MNIYSVKYTSTEKLYEEEIVRKQNIVTVRAKSEEEAKAKVLEKLKSEGRHDNIVIHSARLEGKVKLNLTQMLLLGLGIIVIISLISSLGR
ncbi:hypothetical protein [Paenibacillus senegalensis]|uniref:hypothetical protein n=1 Tax=Paenibacillus senegalensis TaxID=1465766 RepID=UPI000289BE4C|nr:hypothetical protein [Paenibacillus senegalensis]